MRGSLPQSACISQRCLQQPDTDEICRLTIDKVTAATLDFWAVVGGPMGFGVYRFRVPADVGIAPGAGK
jgi:hypothetical protein